MITDGESIVVLYFETSVSFTYHMASIVWHFQLPKYKTDAVVFYMQSMLSGNFVFLLDLPTTNFQSAFSAKWRTLLGSISGSDNGFYVCSFVLLLVCYFLGASNIIWKLHVAIHCHSFCNAIFLDILDILQSMWPIISASKYKHRIFMLTCVR